MLNKNINTITEFYNNYLFDINKDVFSALSYFKKNNESYLYQSVKETIDKMSYDSDNYLGLILDDYSVQKISRLGDMHNKGKCTILVETDIEKFICKPIENIQLINVYHEFLKILNSNSEFDFGFISIEASNSNKRYSRIEYIENEKCFNQNKFAYHYGGLLFFLVLLKGVDFHSENIFCCSSSPVIIDCESLFYPEILNVKSYDVTATSLIPTKSNSNSVMQLFQLPFHEVIKGVDSAYSVIKSNETSFRKIILNNAEKRRRMIFKPTYYYYKILKNSMHPSLMIDIKKRILYLRSSLQGEHEISLAIIDSEIYDLLHFDIPYFYYENNTLFDSTNTKIEQKFLKSSTDEILNDLTSLRLFKNNLIKQMEVV